MGYFGPVARGDRGERMARFSLEVGYATDVGRMRKRNEDSYAVFTPNPAHPGGEPLQGMLLVADGMGGERAGDRASQMAAEGLHQCFASGVYRSWTEFGNGVGEGTWVNDVLRRAIHEINDAILRLGEENPSMRGLGSTVVMALLVDDRMTVAHVGDSRCYRIRQHTIERLTADHTLVARQVAAGLLTPEQALRHPHRNVLTRSLGDANPPQGDVRTEDLEPGDYFVLCSDGLTGGVSDGEILGQSRHHSDPTELAESLVRLANLKDGSDNITVVVGRCIST